MNYSKILVTGGAGFIGSYIVDWLMSEGYEVVVLDNFSEGVMENIVQHLGRENFQLIKGDIRNLITVKKAMEGVNAVFHEAAIVSVTKSTEDPILTDKVNVLGTLNLLKACLDTDVTRFIFSSSTAVYGEPITLPLREDFHTRPISPYGVSKLAAENYCRVFCEVYGLHTVSLRYFNVYGSRQKHGPYSGVIINFINRLSKNKSPIIYGDGSQIRDFINIRDVIEANMLALNSKKAVGETFNIGVGTPITIKELAEMLIEITNKSHLKPIYAKPRPGDILYNYADINKAKKFLGYTPKVPLITGLSEIVKLMYKNS